MAFEFITSSGRDILEKKYCQSGETIEGLYDRVIKSIAKYGGYDVEYANKLRDYVEKGYICFSTPVLVNTGTDRGYSISCFGCHVSDSVPSIMEAGLEFAMLSRYGGGVSLDINQVRPKGSPVRMLGHSPGIMPWVVVYDAITRAANQGEVRGAASAVWTSINHGDALTNIHMRRNQGDAQLHVHKVNHGVTIPSSFMDRVKAKDPGVRELWFDLIKTRFERGEPYIMFEDNVNNANPKCYKDRGIKVTQSNICTEISLASNEDWTFVCCLLSLNVAMFKEWPKDLVEVAMFALDAILEEFIQRAGENSHFAKAVRFARETRAVGLGVLGYHTYLQSQNLAFGSMLAYTFNRHLFKRMYDESLAASQKLAQLKGEPEFLKGYGERFSHRMAIAPTRTNAVIHGHVSEGIQPVFSNAFVDNTAKGNYAWRNSNLEKVLSSHGQNTEEVWADIIVTNGSVQQLGFLSPEEKEVFLTAREIDQVDMIQQAGERQKYIDQAQSLNLFTYPNMDTKYFADLHILAHDVGVKTLYYCKGLSNIKADSSLRKLRTPSVEAIKEECQWCQ